MNTIIRRKNSQGIEITVKIPPQTPDHIVYKLMNAWIHILNCLDVKERV